MNDPEFRRGLLDLELELIRIDLIITRELDRLSPSVRRNGRTASLPCVQIDEPLLDRHFPGSG